jgi:hypothetical protein
MTTKVKFTSGIAKKIENNFYLVTLLNGNNICYKCNMNTIEVCQLIEKHNNIILQ